MAKSGAQSLTFKSVMDRQTDKKKLDVFGRPGGGGWNPISTKLGMVIEDLEHVLARKLFRVWRTVLPLGGAENLGITRPHQLKTTITPWANQTKFWQLTHHEMPYKLCKFCENCARAAPAGRLYTTFWSNPCNSFNFGGRIPLSLHRWGWNLAWRRGFHAKFHAHHCIMSLLWGKKPQNRPLSNLNTGTLRCTQCCRCLQKLAFVFYPPSLGWLCVLHQFQLFISIRMMMLDMT